MDASLPALRIRFPRWPLSDNLSGKDAPAGFSESWEQRRKQTSVRRFVFWLRCFLMLD
jgi:hypothetical protein